VTGRRLLLLLLLRQPRQDILGAGVV